MIAFSARFTPRIISETTAALSIKSCDSNWPIMSATGFGAGGTRNDTAEIVIILKKGL